MTGGVMDEKAKKLEELARPLIQWLNETYHPHVTVIITPIHVELVEGLVGIPVLDYVKD
jgi:hypothetical protein